MWIDYLYIKNETDLNKNKIEMDSMDKPSSELIGNRLQLPSGHVVRLAVGRSRVRSTADPFQGSEIVASDVKHQSHITYRISILLIMS